MDGLTAILADTASALSTQRLHSEMTIRLLDKALDQQGQMTMSLLQSLPAASPAGSGENRRTNSATWANSSAAPAFREPSPSRKEHCCQ
jgi:hypothetical protein